MTVCTASTFCWNYAKQGEFDVGPAIIAVSDRMLTNDYYGIEYEAASPKVRVFGSRFLVLTAGDVPFNSEATERLNAEINARETLTTAEVSATLASIVADMNSRHAERKVLHPVGLDHRTFLESQSVLQPNFVKELTSRLQSETAEIECIVAGVDGQSAHLHHVDGRGLVSVHSGTGFLSIGNGGLHSTAYFMLEGHNPHANLMPALQKTFWAKKRAEVAPGVGSETDVMIVHREGYIQLIPDNVERIEEIYREEVEQARRNASSAVEKVANVFTTATANPNQ